MIRVKIMNACDGRSFIGRKRGLQARSYFCLYFCKLLLSLSLKKRMNREDLSKVDRESVRTATKDDTTKTMHEAGDIYRL